VQRARITEARTELDTAKAIFARLGRLGNTVSEQEKAQAEAAVHSKEAQQRVREAELGEAEVRLKHAKRRLDEVGKESAPTKDAQRIEELEKKIERLQKELETLKKR
jgi:chromosome segregation ATPase